VRWYLNDASLQGQFVTTVAFGNALRVLMEARARSAALKQGLHTSRTMLTAPATSTMNMGKALAELSKEERDLVAIVRRWIDKNGPFIEDDRLSARDDYFEFEGLDVTDTGLGEAARRVAATFDAETFSFSGGSVDFTGSPLGVDQGLREDRLGRHDVPNQTDPGRLAEAAQDAEPLPDTWQAMVRYAQARFTNLNIAELHENKMLSREAFEASLRDRFLEDLLILDTYVNHRTVDGTEEAEARSIREKYFIGKHARITDESDENKNAFRDEMTFRRQTGENYFAPWHSKMKHRQFRLHFEWPLATHRQTLEVFYYGPKITKQ